MKKFTLFTFLLILAGTGTRAQTKRIAHRSHSGSNQHFSFSGSDNFGNPREEYKMTTPLVIDSTKAANEGAKRAGDEKHKKLPRKYRKPAKKQPVYAPNY